MTDDGDRVPRERLHPLIQETLNGDDMPEGGGVLMGWVMIAEWMAPSGDRWLSKVSSDATGVKGAATWQEQGYLHNALHTDWPDGDADTDDPG